MKETTKNKNIMRRTVLVGAIILILVVPMLLYNLYKLQIRDAAEYQSLAIAQQTRDTLISPSRGTIYDRNMTPLAVSATVQTIVISPAEIVDDEEAQAIALGLSKILDLDYDTILSRTKNKKSYYEVIARKVSRAVSDEVRAFKSENKYTGIKLFEDTKRYYPYSNLLSNVIGFTNYDNEGQYGLELKYESSLKGAVGRTITAKNNLGSAMPFYFEHYYDANDGLGLVLTVDYGVEEILEKHLEIAMIENRCAEGALGIIMDIKTGAILGMAQKGDYNLNEPRTISDPEVLATILAQPESEQSTLMLDAMMAQWRNKAIQEPYEPGSVFKIVTAAMALEENVVKPGLSYYCSGVWNIDTTEGYCWKYSGHGSQTFAKSFENSCNSAFVNIALTIGHERFYNYLKAFGLTERTGLDMMGETNTIEGIHYHSWSVFSNPWLGGNVSLGTYGFGQTFKVTPIQLITAVSAIVNGGYLMEPYVVSSLVDANGNIVEKFEPKVVRQVISEETSTKMRELLEGVVTNGTGKNAYVRGYRVGGKTGTSEKRDKSIQFGKDFYIASFLGVAPCDDPQVAVLVLLDEPTGDQFQGGQIAAPVVGRIMSDLMPYLGIKAVYSEQELINMSVAVPLVVGGNRSWAQGMMENAKFNVKIVGDGDKVTAQSPKSGSKIPTTATVVLYCGIELDRTENTIPDLSGKTYEEAVRIAERVGFYIDASGAIGGKVSDEYKVRKQSPAAESGSKAQVGTVIVVEFYSDAELGE